MPPTRTLPKQNKTSERTHEENQERAYIAASRRSDRSLEARVESARRASEIHKKRTGRALKVGEEQVSNEEMYEEEDDEVPHQFRSMAQQMRSGSGNLDYRRLTDWLSSNVSIRASVNQALQNSYSQIPHQQQPIEDQILQMPMHNFVGQQMQPQRPQMPPQQMSSPLTWQHAMNPAVYHQPYNQSPYARPTNQNTSHTHSRNGSVTTKQESNPSLGRGFFSQGSFSGFNTNLTHQALAQYGADYNPQLNNTLLSAEIPGDAQTFLDGKFNPNEMGAHMFMAGTNGLPQSTQDPDFGKMPSEDTLKSDNDLVQPNLEENNSYFDAGFHLGGSNGTPGLDDDIWDTFIQNDSYELINENDGPHSR